MTDLKPISEIMPEHPRRGRIPRRTPDEAPLTQRDELVLESKQISFASLRDTSASTPEEKVLQAMQGVFHQYERVKIAERFRRGKLFKAKQGVLINGQLPYGYERHNRSETSPAKATVNPEEATVVRLIREWYGNDGLSMHAIIKRLHDLAIPPPRRKQLAWKKSSIMRLLRSDAYHRGIVYYNKTEAVVSAKPRSPGVYKRVKKTSRRMRPKTEWLPIKIQPIVPDDGLFERIQRLLDENGRRVPRNRKYAYLLSGRVWCKCGSRRVGDGYGKNHYYRCAQRVYTFPVKGKCRSPGVNAHALDETLWQELAASLGDPQRLHEHAARFLNEPKLRDGNQEATDVMFAQLDQEAERYARAYGASTLSFEQFRRLMKDVQRRRVKIQQLPSEPDQTGLEQPGLDLDALTEAAQSALRSMNTEDRASLVRELVDKVVVSSNEMIEVSAHIPVVANKVGDKHESRDSRNETPRYEFKFSILRPRLRKERIIVARDRLGRITKSKSPSLNQDVGLAS